MHELLRVEIVNKSDNPNPEYAKPGDAGMDLRSNEEGILKPLERRVFKTGLFIAVPQGYEAQIRPRSGMAAKHGITVLNTPGTIDSGYRGEIGVILVNLSNDDFEIKKGERICQMIFAKVEEAALLPVDILSETERGEGGFGSTGKE